MAVKENEPVDVDSLIQAIREAGYDLARLYERNNDGSKYEWFAGVCCSGTSTMSCLDASSTSFSFYESVADVGLPRGQVIRVGLGAIF